MKKLKLIGAILYSVQLALSAVLVFYIFKLDVLPDSVAFGCVLVLTLFAVAGAFLLFLKGTAKKMICACISLFLSILLLIPIRVFQKTDSTLNNLQGETNTYHSNYEVVVRQDDKAEILSDLIGYKTGIDTAYNQASAEEALADIERKIESKLEVMKYGGSSALWTALTETKETDAILIDHSFYEMFREAYEAQNDQIENYVKIVDKITVSVDIEMPPTQSPSVDPEEPVDSAELWERPFVIYVSGIDVAGKITTRSRSDVNILIAINPNTKKMILVTVPRDTYVPFPGVTDGAYDKLTHAGIYGDNCSVSIATLEQYIYTGITIDKWIRVNFTSVERIVDALGGITVESQYNFSSGNYTFVKGMNELNGKQALAFARNRKSFAEGDMQRGRNQLEVIKGIFNKAISPAILSSYSEILDEIADCVQTNLSYDDITGLVKMQLSDGASWQIDTASIYVDYKYDYCYSMSGQKLCVGVMSEESRLEAIEKIHSVLNG